MICYRHAIIWSTLKNKSASRDSRVELLESGSSTPGSTEHGDDIDSSSVTTSSSSEVTAVSVRRDRDVVDRPRHSAGLRAPTDRSQHHLPDSALPPTYSKFEGAECDNDGFISDEVMVTSGQNTQKHPQQQQQHQQQQEPAKSKLADSQTHSISVELHSTPRQSAATDTGNEWKI